MAEEHPVPQHDQVAEEMDLLTHQEAEARVYEELVAVREQLARLESSTDDGTGQQRQAAQTRLVALEAVMARIRADRPA